RNSVAGNRVATGLARASKGGAQEARLLRAAPRHSYIKERRHLHWREAAAGNHAQRAQHREPQLSIANGNSASHQPVEYRTCAGCGHLRATLAHINSARIIAAHQGVIAQEQIREPRVLGVAAVPPIVQPAPGDLNGPELHVPTVIQQQRSEVQASGSSSHLEAVALTEDRAGAAED